ncbi:MAG: hypothetical protein COS89_09335 [Deltaproteobacteria bacterium CG07_land_8_20_14_0_80_38_7]|nr:MAG: hypothetical protein COS89_09335 [Deltaproteobacteria bacterium CG07_land_8_20_14_0_80_38_7]
MNKIELSSRFVPQNICNDVYQDNAIPLLPVHSQDTYLSDTKNSIKELSQRSRTHPPSVQIQTRENQTIYTYSFRVPMRLYPPRITRNALQNRISPRIAIPLFSRRINAEADPDFRVRIHIEAQKIENRIQIRLSVNNTHQGYHIPEDVLQSLAYSLYPPLQQTNFSSFQTEAEISFRQDEQELMFDIDIWHISIHR